MKDEVKVFYTAKEVMALLRVTGKSTLYRLVKRKAIPAPIKISNTIRLWNKKELDSFLKLTEHDRELRNK